MANLAVSFQVDAYRVDSDERDDDLVIRVDDLRLALSETAGRLLDQKWRNGSTLLLAIVDSIDRLEVGWRTAVDDACDCGCDCNCDYTGGCE